jgi:HlyD family secretion protein
MKDSVVRTRSLKGSAKNKWTIWSAIALAIVLSGIGYSYYMKLQASQTSGPVIATTTVSTGDIVLSATGPGTLVPNEEVSFGFKNSGKISEVLAKLGDHVNAGQVLARLDNTTLQLEFNQAEANLAALSSPSQIAVAEQAVQDTKASFATAKNALQFLIGPDMLTAEDNVSSAQQEFQQAKAEAEKDAIEENKEKVTNAETALAKAKEILSAVTYQYSSNYTLQTFTYPVRNSNGITTSRQLFAPTNVEISAAQAAYELAKANLSDAQNYLDVLNGVKTIEQAPASSITAITAAETALDQAKANLDATELTAPISGTVTSIDLNVGDSVGTSAVVTISNTNQPYMLDAYLDETDWDKAKIGYDVTVIFDMLPNKNYPGKIVNVYPVLDDSSGTSLVHIRVQLNSNLNIDLPAGAAASVDVTGGKALGAVLVPVSALKAVEPGKYVVYLMKNGDLVEQQVEIGLQDIVNAEVKSGLKPGDIVLTNATVNK